MSTTGENNNDFFDLMAGIQSGGDTAPLEGKFIIEIEMMFQQDANAQPVKIKHRIHSDFTLLSDDERLELVDDLATLPRPWLVHYFDTKKMKAETHVFDVLTPKTYPETPEGLTDGQRILNEMAEEARREREREIITRNTLGGDQNIAIGSNAGVVDNNSIGFGDPPSADDMTVEARARMLERQRSIQERSMARPSDVEEQIRRAQEIYTQTQRTVGNYHARAGRTPYPGNTTPSAHETVLVSWASAEGVPMHVTLRAANFGNTRVRGQIRFVMHRVPNIIWPWRADYFRSGVKTVLQPTLTEVSNATARDQ
jgi:hypothetical protein